MEVSTFSHLRTTKATPAVKAPPPPPNKNSGDTGASTGVGGGSNTILPTRQHDPHPEIYSSRPYAERHVTAGTGSTHGQPSPRQHTSNVDSLLYWYYDELTASQSDLLRGRRRRGANGQAVLVHPRRARGLRHEGWLLREARRLGHVRRPRVFLEAFQRLCAVSEAVGRSGGGEGVYQGVRAFKW